MSQSQSLSSFSTPSRPTPLFYNSFKSLTTKKERNHYTPTTKRVPPRPPSKSVPPVSRFSKAPKHEKAQAISFVESESSLSKNYDETREESYFEQCFQMECKIGSGSFGDVFKVKSKEDGNYYAIKKSRERFKGKSDRERKLEEVCKHEHLPKHENCVKLYKAWEEKQQLFIQTELCDTSLSDFAEINHDIPEHFVWNCLVDLLRAVRHLHDHDFIHLDIKPDNIFLSSDGLCKLGDFGLVLDLNRNDTNEATEGDPKYLAKELMQGIFTKAADIFSLGITILELACDLDLPSGDEGWHQLRDGNIPESLLNGISDDLRCIIISMMDSNYTRRPTAEELLNNSIIWRKDRVRRMEIGIKKSYAYAKKIVVWFILFFINLFHIICYPITLLCKSLKKKSVIETPPHAINNSKSILDYDNNYSDDEVFDITTVSHNTPQSDASSINSSFGNNISFNNASLVNNRLCSTSVINRHRPPIFDDSFRSPSFKTSSPIQRFYHSTMHESPTFITEPNHSRSKLISQRLDFTNHLEEDDITDWNKSLNIGPKNLLSTFDEIESENEN